MDYNKYIKEARQELKATKDKDKRQELKNDIIYYKNQIKAERIRTKLYRKGNKIQHKLSIINDKLHKNSTKYDIYCEFYTIS